MKKMLVLWALLIVNVFGFEIVVDETLKQFVRDDSKEVVVDKIRNLMWQDDESVKNVKKDWNGAIEYCKNLNFAGFADWRLPSRMELLSIADKTKVNPAMQDGFKNVVFGFYWSNAYFASVSSGAWYVYFVSGNSFYALKVNSRYVRCVRDNK